MKKTEPILHTHAIDGHDELHPYKFEMISPKDHIQGFLVTQDGKSLTIRTGYCDICGTYYFHNGKYIKHISGLVCTNVKIRQNLWYHLFICYIANKSYIFLLDDNHVGNNIKTTNSKITLHRRIAAFRGSRNNKLLGSEYHAFFDR